MATADQSFTSRTIVITFLLVASESYAEQEDILNVCGDQQTIIIDNRIKWPDSVS